MEYINTSKISEIRDITNSIFQSNLTSYIQSDSLVSETASEMSQLHTSVGAASIGYDPTGNTILTSVTVQDVLDQTDSYLSKLNTSVGAASIGYDSTGLSVLTTSTIQTGFSQLDSYLSKLATTVGAASIGYDDSGNVYITAVTAQAALDDAETALSTAYSTLALVSAAASTTQAFVTPLSSTGDPNAGAGTAGSLGKRYHDTATSLVYENFDGTNFGWVVL